MCLAWQLLAIRRSLHHAYRQKCPHRPDGYHDGQHVAYGLTECRYLQHDL